MILLNRLFMLYLTDNKVRHETLWCGNKPQEFPLNMLSCATREDDRARETTGECLKVTVPGTCSLLVPTQDAPSLPFQQNGKRHVTLDSGNHKPLAMKIVAEHVRRGDMSRVEVRRGVFIDLRQAELVHVHDAYPFAIVGVVVSD